MTCAGAHNVVHLQDVTQLVRQVILASHCATVHSDTGSHRRWWDGHDSQNHPLRSSILFGKAKEVEIVIRHLFEYSVDFGRSNKPSIRLRRLRNMLTVPFSVFCPINYPVSINHVVDPRVLSLTPTSRRRFVIPKCAWQEPKGGHGGCGHVQPQIRKEGLCSTRRPRMTTMLVYCYVTPMFLADILQEICLPRWSHATHATYTLLGELSSSLCRCKGEVGQQSHR